MGSITRFKIGLTTYSKRVKMIAAENKPYHKLETENAEISCVRIKIDATVSKYFLMINRITIFVRVTYALFLFN